MMVYVGTMALSMVEIFLDDTPETIYKAPEILTVYIRLHQADGNLVSFRLDRDSYDRLREAIIAQEGYLK